MFGQSDDLQKLVVLNNNVVMQLVQFVGSLQAVQAGTVDALDFLTHGDKGQAVDLLTQAKGSDIFPQAGITFWDVAHETNGGLICDGYTRSTGKMAMAIAQNGPGVTGFVTAVKTAY